MISTDFPEHPESAFPADEEEASSATLPVADTSVLLVCSPGPDVARVRDAVLANNLRFIHAASLERLGEEARGFRHIFLEFGLSGAVNFLRTLGGEEDGVFPVALLARGERPGTALAAGASATLERPLDASDLLLCVNRNRIRLEQLRGWQEMVDRDRHQVATSSVEGVLAALGHEIRNPLAAAMADVEYLLESETTQTELAPSERQGILKDTFDSLQRVRSTLESLASLVRREVPEPRKLVLWHIVQQVLDSLPQTQGVAIRLEGDPTVRGICDEELLTQVASTLIRRAVDVARENAEPSVRVRIYSSETEARISIRDNGSALPPGMQAHLFEPTHAGQVGSSGLLLAMAHHAVVRMAGALTYAARTTGGSVFRVRLRLARYEA